MSADNGLYIAKFPDWYRVAHLQAIENVSYYEKWTKEWERVLDDYFWWLPVYMSKQVAMRKALDMQERVMESKTPILEYWIQYLGDFYYLPKQCKTT